MADLPSDFWGGWVAVITIVSLLGLAWLVYSVYFAKRSDAASRIRSGTRRSRRHGAAAALVVLAHRRAARVHGRLLDPVPRPRQLPRHAAVVARRPARRERRTLRRRVRRRSREIAATAPEELRGDAAVLRSAASVFRNNCAACHGENGGGQAKAFPNLTDREWQWGGETAQLEQTITAGRQAVMPGWQAALGDAGVSAVADYVISLSRVEPGRLGLAEGKRLFGLYCTACHGADGGGTAALGAPPLNDGSWVYGGSTLDVRKTIALGRNGEMPSFASRLDAAQIKMLVALLEQQRVDASDLGALR